MPKADGAEPCVVSLLNTVVVLSWLLLQYEWHRRQYLVCFTTVLRKHPLHPLIRRLRIFVACFCVARFYRYVWLTVFHGAIADLTRPRPRPPSPALVIVVVGVVVVVVIVTATADAGCARTYPGVLHLAGVFGQL